MWQSNNDAAPAVTCDKVRKQTYFDGSSPLGCYAVSSGKYSSTFRRSTVPPSWRSKTSVTRRHHVISQKAWIVINTAVTAQIWFYPGKCLHTAWSFPSWYHCLIHNWQSSGSRRLNVTRKSERMVLGPAESICFDGIWNVNLMHQNQGNYVVK